MAIATTTLEQQARFLAKESRDAISDIDAVLWFPSADQIRLIVVTSECEPADESRRVIAFYFPPAPSVGLDFWSASAMIRPEERGMLELPSEWGDWSDAVEI